MFNKYLQQKSSNHNFSFHTQRVLLNFQCLFCLTSLEGKCFCHREVAINVNKLFAMLLFIVTCLSAFIILYFVVGRLLLFSPFLYWRFCYILDNTLLMQASQAHYFCFCSFYINLIFVLILLNQLHTCLKRRKYLLRTWSYVRTVTQKSMGIMNCMNSLHRICRNNIRLYWVSWKKAEYSTGILFKIGRSSIQLYELGWA